MFLVLHIRLPILSYTPPLRPEYPRVGHPIFHLICSSLACCMSYSCKRPPCTPSTPVVYFIIQKLSVVSNTVHQSRPEKRESRSERSKRLSEREKKAQDEGKVYFVIPDCMQLQARKDGEGKIGEDSRFGCRFGRLVDSEEEKSGRGCECNITDTTMLQTLVHLFFPFFRFLLLLFSSTSPHPHL